ncbi:MAG: hypothetical protein ACOH14_01235 [Rhodoglobus sp.]
MKRAIIGCILASGLVLGGAGAACAYSGQDLPDSIEGNPPGFDGDFVE